jgi:hypothetical protein
MDILPFATPKRIAFPCTFSEGFTSSEALTIRYYDAFTIENYSKTGPSFFACLILSLAYFSIASI